jgi:hypothetical protein
MCLRISEDPDIVINWKIWIHSYMAGSGLRATPMGLSLLFIEFQKLFKGNVKLRISVSSKIDNNSARLG